jgi:hypothetical protein
LSRAKRSEPIAVKVAAKTSYEMIGEYLREVSALILVFMPLDRYIVDGDLSANWLAATLLCSLALFAIGMALENPVE